MYCEHPFLGNGRDNTQGLATVTGDELQATHKWVLSSERRCLHSVIRMGRGCRHIACVETRVYLFFFMFKHLLIYLWLLKHISAELWVFHIN